jgi:hypothetical protein
MSYTDGFFVPVLNYNKVVKFNSYYYKLSNIEYIGEWNEFNTEIYIHDKSIYVKLTLEEYTKLVKEWSIYVQNN